MGYRSDVHAIFYHMSLEKVDAFVAAVKLKGHWEKLDPITLKTVEGDEHKPMLMVEYVDSGVKWYDGYPRPSAMNEMFEIADTLDLHYEFVRIGENYEDISVVRSSDSEGYLAIHRNIVSYYNE